jgi:biopolymer transport protein ExbB
MKNLIAKLAITAFFISSLSLFASAQNKPLPQELKKKAVSTLAADQKHGPSAQPVPPKPDAKNMPPKQGDKPMAHNGVDSAASPAADSAATSALSAQEGDDGTGSFAPEESQGFHQELKTKFIEGSAGFMSLVALALVIGLAFCIERIIYLSLSEINAKRFMGDLEEKIMAKDFDGAKEQCRNTRGPVASICYQGLMRIDQSLDEIERSITSYGSVQAANLEKGCSWITLFIAMAPSLGFLGTVIGMVMAFDQIQQAGDISPTIVAAGMKVALITTIFGIIVALILQIFYNYILSKIEHLVAQMEESSISLLDTIVKYKLTK